jgi:hypothetical protein
MIRSVTQQGEKWMFHKICLIWLCALAICHIESEFLDIPPSICGASMKDHSVVREELW